MFDRSREYYSTCKCNSNNGKSINWSFKYHYCICHLINLWYEQNEIIWCLMTLMIVNGQNAVSSTCWLIEWTRTSGCFPSSFFIVLPVVCSWACRILTETLVKCVFLPLTAVGEKHQTKGHSSLFVFYYWKQHEELHSHLRGVALLIWKLPELSVKFDIS